MIMFKRITAMFLAIVMSAALSIAPSAAYTAKGTGEARPETRTESREYSTYAQLMTEGYSQEQIGVGIYTGETDRYVYYENFSETPEYDINKALLNGVLENAETEKKINNWVKAQYKKTGKRGVYYEAVNGYMSVVFGVFYDKNSDEKREPITSCWNLKSGEQLTKFSDLFYKDSDFLPAVNAKYKDSSVFNAEQYFATENTKNFTFMKLTESYFDGKYFQSPQNVSDEMNNAEAYKLMPAWEYFDMKPLFTKAYRDQVENKTTDLYAEWYSVYGEKPPSLKEMKIHRSRFFTESEISRRNSELEALYDVIEKSDEYKNYKTDENFIETSFDFSADGKTAIIYTPFGEFTKNGDEIKTPVTDYIMKPEIGFIGYVDFDMDGTAEKITSGEEIAVRNSKDEVIFTIPLGWTQEYKDYYKALLWSIEKDENDDFYCRIVTALGEQTYIIEDGKAELYTTAIGHGSSAGETAYLKYATVIYSYGALDYGELGYASGAAKADSDKLQAQIKSLRENSPDSFFAMLNVEHGKSQIIGTSKKEKVIFINGKANDKNELPAEQIRVSLNSAFDSDRDRAEVSMLLQFAENKVGINTVPAFITSEDTLTFPLGEEGIGEWLSAHYSGEGLLVADDRTNEYYFYRDGDELVEYGAVPITLEQFKVIDGSDEVLKNIAERGAAVDEILLRECGSPFVRMLHINYTQKDENGKEVSMTFTLSVNYYNAQNPETGKDKTVWRVNPSVEEQKGTYLPSIFETIETRGIERVVYPEVLPG
jgi:hypothetical protein